MSDLKVDGIIASTGSNTDLELSGKGTGGVKITDYLIQTKGSDIASATALTLGKDANLFDVTGTTTITSIATQGIGSIVTLHFDGILTFTHHSTDLILPGAANITTAAGDIAVMYEYASGDWRCISYSKASGAAVVAPVGGASAAEKTNIMLNSFRLAIGGGISFQNMVDGVVDEFEDELGIDTSTSASENYSGTNDSYSNSTLAQTSSTSSAWTGSAMTYTGADIISGVTSYNFVRSVDPVLSADFIFRAEAQALGAPYSSNMGCYASSEDGTFSSGASRGGTVSMTAAFVMRTDSTSAKAYYGNTLVSTSTLMANGEVAEISRVGSTISFKVDGVVRHTYTQTYSGNMRLIIGGDWESGSDRWDEVSWDLPAAAANMTLFSNATTALAAPGDVNIIIWQEDVDSVTLNTDLKAYGSRNGGTTYTQMTLAEVANLTTGRILTGAVDISAQSSATAMKYKLETFNNKEQKFHAVALQWS